MSGFGEFLRNERLQRGVSLEQIAATTRIGMRHLTALEREQFEELPGGVYNRGYVRAYAACVGLDEAATLRAFTLATPGDDGEVEASLARCVPDGWRSVARNVITAWR